MSPNFSPGARLGHYEIKSQLGAGGMGEVYLAQDTKLDRKVAIKFLHEEFSKDADKLARFIQEARAASALNHPNILTVYEIGEVDGKNYISTELIDGQTLREHLSQKESLQLNQILKIGEQVSEALSAAHQAGIVHRDIKPENIMLRKDGYAKVLDFGLAKLSEPKAIATGSEDATRVQVNTTPGMVMGTVSYMSPEQARGNVTDARTDIWSLGVVLYEMLAGKVPFTGETVNHTIVSILEKEPLLLENVPAELQRIVRKSMTKDGDMRYQSARDLLIDLKNLRRDLDIQGELDRSIVPNRETANSSLENATQMYAADVVAATSSGQAAATQSLTTSSSSLEYAVTQAKSHKLATAIIGILLVGVISAAGYFAFVSRSGSTKQISSIAVMPFVNESGNADVEYLSDGMTETLISSLSNLPNLSVKPRSSVFRYKGKETNPQTIARELNVQAILNGRVVQRGNEITLYIELIDAQKDTVLWKGDYNRQMSNLVTLQSEIARDVSGKLKSKLSGAEIAAVEKVYTNNPEAYRLYLKGVYHAAKFNKEELDIGFGYLRQAVALDPNYALAYHGLAYYHYLIVDWTMSPHEAMPKAKEEALKAIELDDKLAVAHADLGAVYWYYDWNWPAAEKEFKRAIELDPDDSLSHEMYGWYLVTMGRVDEGIAELKRGQQLDPLAQERTSVLGWNLYLARRYDESIEQHRKAIELEPDYWPGYSWLGNALAQKGRWPEAIEAFQKAISIEPVIAVPTIGLGRVYAVSGKKDEAIKVLAELNDRSKHPYVSSYLIASIYAGLGDKDKAFASLERAYEDRSWYMNHLKLDPELDSLHSDPRFADLVRRVGLP
jgi:eukaryotic-like serine/threonine-protein kinase